MHWVPYGPNAMMLYFAERPNEEGFATSCALMQRLRTAPPPGLIEYTPGFTSFLLEFDSGITSDFRAMADGLVVELQHIVAAEIPTSPIVEIPVNYDGPDLERVASHNNITIDEVIRLHFEPTYHVHLLGFAPGFPYLSGLNPRLHTPRMQVPRTLVPAGSVAIGGEHAGIYPVNSPGGWNLIGRTEVKLLTLHAGSSAPVEEMFRLQAGYRVKFVRL